MQCNEQIISHTLLIEINPHLVNNRTKQTSPLMCPLTTYKLGTSSFKTQSIIKHWKFGKKINASQWLYIMKVKS